ncbi:MAG: PAS domain-containing protein [Rubrivivax sp.]|nr:PAS domain-containing protein [Rubrivivax sp.]
MNIPWPALVILLLAALGAGVAIAATLAPATPPGGNLPAGATSAADAAGAVARAGDMVLRDALARAEAAAAAAEARARAAEERVQLALRGSQDGLWEWQIGRSRMQLSPRWLGMLGHGPDEVPETRDGWLQCVHADDRAGLRQAMDGLLQPGGGDRLEREFRLLHRDGSVRHVLSRMLLLRDEQGRPERLLGLDTDVTRLKRVQAVLDAVAEGTAGTHGDRFFAAMAEHLARALEVDCAFITECADHQPTTRVRTLAWWSTGEGLRENFEYDLAGTPCEEVIQGARVCFHPERLAELFPREKGREAFVGLPIVGSDGSVLGHVALMHGARLGEEVLVERVYRIFLARAAVEIERARALARLALLGDRAAQPGAA